LTYYFDQSAAQVLTLGLKRRVDSIRELLLVNRTISAVMVKDAVDLLICIVLLNIGLF
jgi:hypothetical protein